MEIVSQDLLFEIAILMKHWEIFKQKCENYNIKLYLTQLFPTVFPLNMLI